jgi:hypothetical protein
MVGLGFHIADNIVTNRVAGPIDLDSKDGECIRSIFWFHAWHRLNARRK